MDQFFSNGSHLRNSAMNRKFLPKFKSKILRQKLSCLYKSAGKEIFHNSKVSLPNVEVCVFPTDSD